MLQAIRDRATGWIAWVIIILICIPFALWGVNQYFGPDEGLVVAQVDDSEIGYYQYRNAYQQRRARLQQMFGGSIPPALLDDAALRRQSLDALINDEVLVQQAVRNGLRVGDAQLATAILEQPPFQEDGAFSQAAYDRFLRSRGSSPQSFELEMRRSMLGEQLITAVRRTAIVTGADLQRALRMRNEQRSFRLLRVDAAKLEVPEPSEEAIQEWFEANPELYVQPEQVRVRYLELDRAALMSGITVDEAELRAIYDDRGAQGAYVTPEQREARHILVNLGMDASQEETDAAREKLLTMRARIAAGEDFAAVAKEGSDDPGSAPLGGSLGFFGRGVMDPAFEEAAFGQAEGVLGEPVRSRFGWHLIEVTGVQPEKTRSFEEARADVLSSYQETQAEQIFAEQAERLATLGFEHPESLEAAAEALDLEPQETSFFSREGAGATGVAANPRVRAAAFSEEVLAAGNNSELIDLGPSRVALLRVVERQASRPKTLDEVRAEITEKLKSDASADMAKAVGAEMLESLRSGQPLEEVAAAQGLEWAAERSITRDATDGVAQAVVAELFKMPSPTAGSTFEGVSLPGDAYGVIAYTKMGQAEPSAEEASKGRERVAQSLESGLGQQALSAVMEMLREQSEVKVFETNLRPDES